MIRHSLYRPSLDGCIRHNWCFFNNRELACLQFVILRLQFDPLSLDIYHPLVGLVVGLVAVWVLIAWLLCRPNFFVAASSWVVSS
jgi:hypothetical protein